jgi:hypothetical protein
MLVNAAQFNLIHNSFNFSGSEPVTILPLYMFSKILHAFLLSGICHPIILTFHNSLTLQSLHVILSSFTATTF